MRIKFLSLFLIVAGFNIYSQSIPKDVLEQLNNNQSTEVYSDEASQNIQDNNIENLSEPTIPVKDEAPSKIESIYKSYGYNLEQFGYDYLNSNRDDILVNNDSNYLLGSGDTIKVYLWGDPVDIGELIGQYKLTLNSAGAIYFPSVGLLNISGKSLESVKEIIRAGLEQKYKKFSLDISVVNFKRFSVSVTGMVNSPGVVNVTSLSTLFTALNRAGGISKEGSLRDVILKRGEEEIVFDLYDSLIFGNNSISRFLLKDGDSVYVKPIGSVTAITGAVKKQGIFELKGEPLLKDVINYSGGELISSYTANPLFFFLDSSTGVLKNIEKGLDSSVTEMASIIYFPDMSPEYGNSVTVSGAVRNPGRFDLGMGLNLSDLVENLEYTANINLFYGEIERQRVGAFKEYITFKPNNLNKSDIKLYPEDKITFYSYGAKPRVNQDTFRDYITIKGVAGSDLYISNYSETYLNDIISRDLLPTDVDMDYATIVRKSESSGEVITFSPTEVLNGLEIKLNSLDEVVFYPKWEKPPVVISGELEESFVIDYYDGLTLMEALSGAIFKSSIESLRARVVTKDSAKTVYLHDLMALGKPSADLKLTPGSRILIQKLSNREDRSRVKILGEINQPGIVKIDGKTTLFDVLSKSGGLRDDAYLKGLVLIRESAKSKQREQLEITLNSMEAQLETMALEAEKSSLSPEALASVKSQVIAQSTLIELTRSRAESTLGRLSLNLPDTLSELKKSKDNIVLEKGDYIFIPSTPDYVLVLGNVYNQISVKYSSNTTVDGYLNRVGGLKKNSGELYIVHANGEITSQNNFGIFSKSIRKRTLKPGDVIVIPQEVKVPSHLVFTDSFEKVVDIIYKTTTSVFTTYSMLNQFGAL